MSGPRDGKGASKGPENRGNPASFFFPSTSLPMAVAVAAAAAQQWQGSQGSHLQLRERGTLHSDQRSFGPKSMVPIPITFILLVSYHSFDQDADVVERSKYQSKENKTPAF